MSQEANKQINPDLMKSIDSLIDEAFSEENNDSVEKSIDISKDSSTKADEVANKAPKYKDDDARGAGRPKQVSDIPSNDQDGSRAKGYDSIQEDEKEEDQKEAKQVKETNQVKGKDSKGSEAPKYMKKSLTEEEWEEYMELKKAKEAEEQEKLKKAEEEKQEALIKAVVEKTSAKYEEKIEALTKSLTEQETLIKAMANQPKQRKSVENVAALEKSQAEESQGEYFSKSEMQDAAEELALNKSFPEFSEDHAIELNSNGYIYDKSARECLENYLQKK